MISQNATRRGIRDIIAMSSGFNDMATLYVSQAQLAALHRRMSGSKIGPRISTIMKVVMADEKLMTLFSQFGIEADTVPTGHEDVVRLPELDMAQDLRW